MVGWQKVFFFFYILMFFLWVFERFVVRRVSMQRHFDVKSEFSIVQGGLKWAFKTLSNIWTEILSDLSCPLNPSWRIGRTNQARKLSCKKTTICWRIGRTIGITNQARKVLIFLQQDAQPILKKSCSKPKLRMMTKRTSTLFFGLDTDTIQYFFSPKLYFLKGVFFWKRFLSDSLFSWSLFEESLFSENLFSKLYFPKKNCQKCMFSGTVLSKTVCSKTVLF